MMESADKVIEDRELILGALFEIKEVIKNIEIIITRGGRDITAKGRIKNKQGVGGE